MHGPEKSDPPIVAGKSANKAASAAAELTEPRGGIEGKAGLQSTVRTRSRAAVSQAQDRLRQAVARNGKEKLTALLHHVSLDTLRWAFLEQRRDAAPGGRSPDLGGVRGRPGGPARRSPRPSPPRRLPGAAVPATVHTEAGRRATAARHRRAGGQDRPDRGGGHRDAGLRVGVPRLQLRFPAR